MTQKTLLPHLYRVIYACINVETLISQIQIQAPQFYCVIQIRRGRKVFFPIWFCCAADRLEKPFLFVWPTSRDPAVKPLRSDSIHTSDWHTHFTHWTGGEEHQWLKPHCCQLAPLQEMLHLLLGETWRRARHVQLQCRDPCLSMALRVIRLTNSQLITRSDPFLIWMNHRESLINSVTCSLWCYSNNTGSAGGLWGDWKRILMTSLEGTLRRQLPPVCWQRPGPSLSPASCPLITPLAWRSRYKWNGDMELNHIQISSLGNITLDLERPFLLLSSRWYPVFCWSFVRFQKHPSQDPHVNQAHCAIYSI